MLGVIGNKLVGMRVHIKDDCTIPEYAGKKGTIIECKYVDTKGYEYYIKLDGSMTVNIYGIIRDEFHIIRDAQYFRDKGWRVEVGKYRKSSIKKITMKDIILRILKSDDMNYFILVTNPSGHSQSFMVEKEVSLSDAWDYVVKKVIPDWNKK